MGIYLDHAATTPMKPEVVEAMLPFMNEVFGNPSSLHQWGRAARMALDQARQDIASQLGTSPNAITFTSGGTESDNLAIIGVAMANRDRGKHIITTQIEHHAVIEACQYLERVGFDVTYLPVNSHGKVELATLQAAIRSDTSLVSVMYGNNEVGTIQDIAEIGHFLRELDIYFHTDAVQALGAIPIDLSQLPVDLVSISAHKINGPKGVGAIIRPPHIKVAPLIYGGSQEKKRRAGTENVSGIVGFATALRLAADSRKDNEERYLSYRKRMLEIFQQGKLQYVVNGHPTDSLAHILNVSFLGADTESLLMNLDLEGIASSSGSACTAGSLEPSHVLFAMGLSSEVIRSAIRLSFGSTNTMGQIETAAHKIVQIVQRLVR